MKKKFLFAVMSLSIVMFAWGCSKKNEETPGSTVDLDVVDGDTTGDTTGETGTEAPATTLPEKEEYVVSDYITLGEYKGIEVTVDEIVVTDADVEARIQEDISKNVTTKEVTGRVVKEGDIVNIDYEGLKDGVAFDGGTAAGTDLTIGSGQFIPGFEEGIVGTNVGDKLALDITFPQEYSNNPDLAGQAVVFNVTVNAIKEEIVPELTEEFAKDVMSYDSLDAYRKGTLEILEAEAVETMKTTKINNVFQAILENAEISSHPQTLIDYYSAEMTNYYNQYAAMFGMEVADLVASSGITVEQYEEEVKTYAESMAGQELVIKAIIEAEKMDVTDEEYAEGVAKLMADFNYETEEDLLAVGSKEQVKETILWQKVLEYVTGLAVELKAE